MIEAQTAPEGVSNGDVRERRLRVLSLCLLYPNPTQPNQGVFVERRLKHLAEIADLKIVSPFAIVQYGNSKGKRVRIGNKECPRRRLDGNVDVFHPRWFYPPYSGSLTPFWLFAQLFFKLASLRKEFTFDVLDAHFGYPDGIAGCLLATALKVPFTITFRGNEPKHSRSRLGRWSMAYAARRASRIFAVSETLRAFAIGLGVDPDRVRVIPNGVDGAVFRPREKRACRLKYGIPAGGRVVLSAGALVERKGHHRVIEALEMLAGEGMDSYLLIAGGPGPEGAFENDLKKLVSNSKLEQCVRFCGPVDAETLAELMSAADIFCLASTNEGWPNVVHEALACGVPVVATNVGAVPEMLAGGRGLVVARNEPRQLKDALKASFQRSWDRGAISEWARGRSWEQVASEVRQELEAIVPKKRV